jgi:hypothetical protein
MKPALVFRQLACAWWLGAVFDFKQSDNAHVANYQIGEAVANIASVKDSATWYAAQCFPYLGMVAVTFAVLHFTALFCFSYSALSLYAAFAISYAC